MDAKQAVKAIEGRLPEEERRDREAHAEAIRAGEGDPGEAAVAELEAKIESAEREASGLVDACSSARRDLLVELVGARGAQWVETMASEKATLVRKAAKQLAAAQATVEEMDALQRLIVWLDKTKAEGKLPPSTSVPREKLGVGHTTYKASDLIGKLLDQITGTEDRRLKERLREQERLQSKRDRDQARRHHPVTKCKGG